jgi:hypothetical protein
MTEVSFTHASYAFILVGQYIVENIIFILAGVLIYQKEMKTN